MKQNNFVFKTVLFECKTEKQNSQCEHGQTMEQTRGLFCTCNAGAHFTTLLANKFNVRGVLQGQVSLGAVNQIQVIHEAMNCCKNLNIH